MINVPEEYLYTKEHEWIKIGAKGAPCTVGITDYAQSKLGDVVMVELPKVGSTISAGGVAATIESFKAVSEIYSPVTGRIVEANESLSHDPGLVNRDPYGGGWMFKLDAEKLEAERGTLLSASQYRLIVEGAE